MPSLEEDGYEFALNGKDIQATYRRLITMGFTRKEAGNLVAILVGLAATEKGWTPKQVKDMLFLVFLDDKLDK